MSFPPPLPPDQAPKGDSTYNTIADKVGMVPNIRKKDNLYQGICVVVFLIIGAVVGKIMEEGTMGLMLGALGGLVAGVLISGVVLMVIGLIRKS